MTTVYFATNRRPNDPDNPTDFTDEFAGDLDSVRFGRAEIAGEALYEKDDLVQLGGDAEITVSGESLHATDLSRSELGSTVTFGEIRAEMAAGKDALLLVHGYNYSFRESIARAAQIGQWYNQPDRVVIAFAWPSLGRGVSPTNYRDERRRGEASGFALGRGILTAADFIRDIAQEDRCERRIHLVAHSMGNWVLRGAVQAMTGFVGENIPPMFDQVVLLAADEDDDTLTRPHKMAPLVNGCNRLSVYHNVQDLALAASDNVMGNPTRLGTFGPDDRDDLSRKVTTVNVAPAIVWSAEVGFDEWQDGPPPWDDYEPWQRDPTGHQYYRNNPTVRNDIRQVLAGRANEVIRGRTDMGDHFRIDDPFQG